MYNNLKTLILGLKIPKPISILKTLAFRAFLVKTYSGLLGKRRKNRQRTIPKTTFLDIFQGIHVRIIVHKMRKKVTNGLHIKKHKNTGYYWQNPPENP